MQKPRRGAAGLLLALTLIVPAPVLAGCRGGVTKSFEQSAEEAAQQAARQGARDFAKRAGPAGGAGGVVVGGCASSDKCP